jgi:predicted RNase H-related nuclease YkuK (DUF458 family)
MQPWRCLSGAWVDDPSVLLSALSADDPIALHVGADSKTRGDHTLFVTVLALVRPGGGGRVVYRTTRERKMKSLAQRLFHEAQLAIELATIVTETSGRPVVVHIDANPDERHKSSRYARSLAGMGIGQGFEVRLKPDAWAATCVADHVVKGKHARVVRAA